LEVVKLIQEKIIRKPNTTSWREDKSEGRVGKLSTHYVIETVKHSIHNENIPTLTADKKQPPNGEKVVLKSYFNVH
jgi:hypothetical protein